VLLDVRRDERAERHDLEPLPARVAERGRDQRGAEASPLAHGVDLRVRERDALAASVIGRKPDDAIAYYNRGATYKLKGDFDRAIADFSKAIELKPDYAAAYDARGLVHVAKGDYVQALADVTRANELVAKRAKKQVSTVTVTTKKKAPPRPKANVIAKASPPANAAATDQLPKWAPLDQSFQ